MTAKYIDLKEELAHSVVVGAGITAIRNALRWLDEHPDQVPGRTITASEFIRAANGVWGDEGSGPNGSNGYAFGLAHRLGITVVPDPEPTNAELIDEAYEVWDRDPQDFTFGEYLVRLGWTKAPGGDDEH